MAHQAITAEMTEEEFDDHVMDILARELGAGGFARYLMRHKSGSGDYTAWRQANPDPRTVADFWNEMEALGPTGKD